MNNMVKFEILEIGKTYKMSGLDVVCVKLKKNGLYRMQTLGMTSGKWPGSDDISDYDDVTETFAKEWAGVISKFKLPKLTDKMLDCKDRTREALVGAAARYKQFGASNSYAWLGTVSSGGFAWCAHSSGSFSGNGFLACSYVIAPAFSLDPSKVILDGDEIKRVPEVILKPGKEYKMSGHRVVCIKYKKDGLYKMQTMGMTSGKWPGDGDISSYDKITSFFALTWKGVISNFRLPKLTNKIKAHEGKTYEALINAALNHSSFGASGGSAWLGTVYGSNYAWCVTSGGYVHNDGGQSYSYVVAPAFNLDPSKVILGGDEIKRKPEESESDNPVNTQSDMIESDIADLIMQFARLWGQHEAYINSAADEDLSDELKQYDSVELLELLTKWAKEYMESDIEDTCEFFEAKLKKLSELEVAA